MQVKVNREVVLRFFDERQEATAYQTTSIAALAGEDLGAGLFVDYLKRVCRCEAEVVGKRGPTPGTRSGARLDRWIESSWPSGERVLYQTEIKNWSVYAIGGGPLSAKACEADVQAYCDKHWSGQWDDSAGTFRSPTVKKVLGRMKAPEGYEHWPRKALAIYWWAVRPGADDGCFFTMPVSEECPGGFKEVSVFSASLYLRAVKESTLLLDMPELAGRLKALEGMFSLAD
jgi:hypothetical protein